MKTLTLNLKRVHFEAIRRGEKTEEYRLVKPYWQRRLVGRQYDQVCFCSGYPSRSDAKRRIIRRYAGYKIKRITHPEFGKDSVEVFAIGVQRPQTTACRRPRKAAPVEFDQLD